MSKRSEFEAMIKELKAYSQHPTIVKCIDLLEKYKPKPYKSRKRSDCICGEKGRNITVWWHMSGDYWFCECPKCEIKAPGSKKYVDAIQKWNRMTEELRAMNTPLSEGLGGVYKPGEASTRNGGCVSPQ